jgi:hypothetical protein
MQITNLTPNNAHKSDALTTLRRTWRWLTLVHSDDPVRAVLNRGFASVITVMLIIAIVLAFLRKGSHLYADYKPYS